MKRWVFVACALGTIALGLLVHSYGGGLSPTSRDVLGDVLWAAMIAWWIGAISPRLALPKRAAVAITICFAVELSQLYHTPSLDALRSTTIGQLTLGSGFDPRDLVAYLAGVLLAVFVERVGRVSHPPHLGSARPPIR